MTRRAEGRRNVARAVAAAMLLAVGTAPHTHAQSGPSPPPPPASRPPAPAPHPPFPPLRTTVTTVAVPSPVDDRACLGRFVEHLLEHTTDAGGGRIGFYASNGAGVGIGDLDGDGDLDVVLANLAGANTVHWNEGVLRFRVERLPMGASRAVHLVDADGDGRLDLFFTHSVAPPSLWLNARGSDGTEFVRVDAGVREPLYTADWGDFDADGDLDLAGATYDAELHSMAPGASGGVFVYRNDGDPRAPGGLLRPDTKLATRSLALAVLASDLNGDGRIDIAVGNDFFLPDYEWLWSADGWYPGGLFGRMAHNTMSLDAGDVNNDGHMDVLATDMKPYASDAEAQHAWEPLQLPPAPDPAQTDRNVLQVATAAGVYRERGVEWGIDASGWSWSSRLGDLDNDGFLDAYIVNGMIAAELFEHLPGDELVEENQAFRNAQGIRFVPAPEWGLGARESGRGMSMADLDADGDLDIVINNLAAPARLFENRLCGGDHLQMDLRWPAANRYALGAQVHLDTSNGSYLRTVRAAGGYLSGDAPRLHFGVPPGSRLLAARIVWPDGRPSSLPAPPLNHLITVTRHTNPAER